MIRFLATLIRPRRTVRKSREYVHPDLWMVAGRVGADAPATEILPDVFDVASGVRLADDGEPRIPWLHGPEVA